MSSNSVIWVFEIYKNCVNQFLEILNYFKKVFWRFYF